MKSDTIGKLSEALAKAQGEMESATFNRVNPHFKSKYADLASCRAAVTPALSRNGLAVTQVTQLIVDADVLRLVLVTRLTHTSGEWIESAYPLPYAPDRPQVMGSALTYARRYALSAITGIASEEDDDGNEAEKNKIDKTKDALRMETGAVRNDMENDFPVERRDQVSSQARGLADSFKKCATSDELAAAWAASQKTIRALHIADRQYLDGIKDELKKTLGATAHG
jgi:hypothetical protein